MKKTAMMGLIVLLASWGTAEDGSRWSVAGGVQMRQISADFSAPSPGGFAGWMSVYGGGGGNGALELYDGVAPRLQYSDGAIIFDPVFTPVDGSALFGVDHASQLGVNPANGYDTVTFSSSINRMSSHVSGDGLSGDDTTWSAEAWVSASMALIRKSSWTLAALARYGLAQSSMDSGRQQTAGQNIVRKDTTGRFEYDVDPQSANLLPPPFEGTGGDYWIVYDAQTYNDSYVIFSTMDPRASVTSSSRTVDRITAWSEADLDVTLHEFMFGVSLAVRPMNRLSVVLNAGPTVNCISWDLKGTTSWESEHTGAVLASASADDSDTDTAIGFATDVAVQFDVDAAGRFYLEANAGYSWVEPVKAEAGTFKANIDASSFTAGAAIGVRM